MRIPSFSASRPCRFVVLVSGRGSNLKSIAAACAAQGWSARIVAVVSNQPAAEGLGWAEAQGIPTVVVPHVGHPDRASFDAALAKAIDAFEPDYVLLAGFMRILTDGFVERYAGRLINIHPSLLPMFPGLATHRQALEAGVQAHGCTVHFVTPVLDHGPIIAQGVVEVGAADTEAALAERVLQVEHEAYPAVARWLAEGRVHLEAGRVRVDGNPQRLFGLRDDPPTAANAGEQA